MKKLQIIESPEETMMTREEMEEVLAGWTCNSYNGKYCGTYAADGTCDAGGDFCTQYAIRQ